MNNSFNGTCNCSKIKSFVLNNNINKYTLLLEKGWWTGKEAICIFLKLDFSVLNDDTYFSEICRNQGNHISTLVNAAIRSGSIKNHVIEPHLWSNRAPCKDWLDWGLTKPSIAPNLDVELLKAAGIEIDQVPRDNASYRPEDEKWIKKAFIAISKSILFICPNARLADIKKLIENAKAIDYLPVDRTLRKWISEEQIHLFPTNQTDDEKLKIEKKLAPLLQS